MKKLIEIIKSILLYIRNLFIKQYEENEDPEPEEKVTEKEKPESKQITIKWNPLRIPKKFRKKERKKIFDEYHEAGYQAYIHPRRKVIGPEIITFFKR